MNIKQYLKFTDTKFIITTEHLFISYNENPKTNLWESTIINLITKQHFKNLNSLIDKYPLSYQLNIPITSTSHKLILEPTKYEESISVHDNITKLIYTTGNVKYSINLNPHTLAYIPNTEPKEETVSDLLLQAMRVNLNNRLLRIPPDQLQNLFVTHDGELFHVSYPDNNHREIWDL